ncbi:Multidrug resistance ABC transporter ATP-binding/permease protein BmrA (plasmid) [Jeotgalibaca dankookensis]|uniref:Multidrug resistance ABC transporter ATP-binding/permease protein BmrA n=2 Tax=Jeotgalibaca dankookensis TaxID=708126 RepID=A0A1S6ISA4_9LACT|nr:Multidrug resistance ABC transporter ATP-binding/permease protein BmrA [Jeotgalibaca dankookensis]
MGYKRKIIKIMKIKLLDFFSITIPFTVGIVINILGVGFNVLVPIAMRKFIDFDSKVISNNKSLVLLFVVLLLQIILTSIGTFIISIEGDKQISKIRLKIKRHLLELPTSYFDSRNSGELSSRIINDVAILRVFLTINIPQMINGIITILISAVILFLLDWKLAIILFCIFPLNALITFPIGKINERIANKTQKTISRLVGITSENFKNIRTIKLNNAEKNVFSKYSDEINDLYVLSFKANKIFALTQPLQRLFAISLIIVVILYGGFRVSRGTLTVGTLISFIIFLFQLIGPINNVADFYNSYKRAIGSTKEISAIMETETENNTLPILKIKEISKPYKLELKNVTFSYDEITVLKNVSMDFNTGEKIAIVGSTGAGKSTVLNLITRLYPVDSGSLYLNEKKASDFKLDNWRSLFSVVSQENTLFSGNIRDNLMFGLDKEISNQKLEDALKFAYLDKEIDSFPEGINTIVGEQGIKLSGGQRQRLQIARAYLKGADFLLLDEATSSLDSYSEKIISENVNKLMKGKTVIAIAHRISTIVNADKIYFIENKKIKDVGTHNELYKRVPAYKRFVEEQIIDTSLS